MSPRIRSALVGFAFTLAGSGAFAESAKGRVITINVIPITGHVQMPMATVDVGRIEPKLTLNELRETFIGRIARAGGRDPY